jgi:hypothetical protein
MKTPHLVLVGILTASLGGCSQVDNETKGTGTNLDGQDSGAADAATTASPSDTAQINDAAAQPPADCFELQRAARAAYLKHEAEVPQCEQDDDCDRSFPRPGGQCWADCAFDEFGSAARSAQAKAAMKLVLKEECAKANEQSCVVLPPSCPSLTPLELHCLNGECVQVSE